MSEDSLAFEEKLDLRSWGLPEHILQKYMLRGVKRMFPWQVECLMSGDVLLGGNLIYSAPTSAGKTLVAEILAIKTVLERRKKVIIILPFVSVVREKMIYFQEILSASGIRVEGFMGSYNPPGGFRSVHLAICTIEKANNLINRLMEERNLNEIGTIIVDELHLLGDPHRGYLLELLLTKLKYICQKGLAANIQIIGMSATLPNLDVLASWMNATLYHTEFRPIPLFEHLKIGRNVYKAPNLDQCLEIKPEIEIKNDPGDVVYLCLDTILQGYSLLVFCPTKNWCETLAVQISSEIKKLGKENNNVGNSLRSELNSTGLSDILEQLRKCPVGLEKNLAQSVSFGVAYHHAGLTLDERDIVEGGFKQNILRVLVATSTLSSGVNLPARRVIIRTPGFQGQCMDILTYKQMIGRAGRMGKDTAGESFLICTESDKVWGKQLLTSELPAVKSCLGQGNLSNSLKRALLEVIACGIVSTNTEVQDYTKCTLLAASVSEDKILQAIDLCTNYLQENEFIKVNLLGNILPSSLAEACLSASVPPDQALCLLRELHNARQCFVLDSDLHAIYQVTPYSICDYWTVDWMRVFTIWENLPSNFQKIGELIGVEDRFLIKAMRGTINLNASEHVHKVSIHKRFYTALALQDLINEVPLNDVALKYDCNKGVLQSLQQSASTFAAMVTSFCRRLGWGGLEVLLSELSTRIQFGVQKDLLDLLRLDCMTALMARALFNASISTITELASSPLLSVQAAISKVKPFQSEIMCMNKEKKNFYLPGRPGLSEIQVADLLIKEARTFLLKEMGVKTAQWETSNVKLVNDSVYECSTICFEEQNKNLKIETNHHDANKCGVIDSSCNNQYNDSENNKEPNNITDMVSNRMLDAGKSILESQIHKKANAGRSEQVIKIVKEKITENKNFQNDITFSLDLDNNLEKIDMINRSALELQDINRSTKLTTEMEKVCIELDDTELIDTQFISRATTRKNKNTSCCSFICDNILEGKINQTHLSDNGYILTNFEKNNGLSSLNASVEKKFSQQDKALQATGNSINNQTDMKQNYCLNIIDYAPDPIFNDLSPLYSKSDGRKRNMPPLELQESENTPNIDINDITKITSEDKSKHNKLSHINTKLNCSTPVSLYAHDDANLSNNDMFSDSPQLPSSSIKQETDCIKNQTLEEFDINWGGDSLLEFSQIETKILETFNEKNTLKRKHTETNEELNRSKKKICLLKEREECFIKESINISDFYDSIPCITQIKNITNINDQFTKSNYSDSKVNLVRNRSEIFNKPDTTVNKYLSLKKYPKSEENIASKCVTELKKKDYLTDTFLSNAFDATFKYKLTEMLTEDINSERDDLTILDLSISDSEDFITRSPEQFQKNKKDFNLKCPSGNDKFPNTFCQMSSPVKVTSKSSPAKCVSPMKYPPIGGDIIKLSKSPSSKKKPLINISIGNSKKYENKSAKCLMLQYAKVSDVNIPVIKIDKTSTDSNEIIKDILHAEEVSFLIKTKKISEDGNKIGSKIIKNVATEEMQYQFKFGDEAIVGIFFFDGKTVYNFDMIHAEKKHISLLKEVIGRETLKLCGFNTKKSFKLLYNCCNVIAKCKVFDIAVAVWLLDPEEKYKSLEDMAKEFLRKPIRSDCGMDNNVSQELITLIALQDELFKRLKELNIEKLFTEVEMPIQRCLLYMELTGIGFDHRIANDLWSLSTELMGKLEMDGFSLARQKFSLNSNAELSKVIRNLKILPDQEVQNSLKEIVQNWRKLHSLKTKNLSQLLFINNIRCYCCSSTRSVTGRIMIYDPDLQHIPRNFIVSNNPFSLRSAFITRSGNVFVSADYCQLELRILAHFAQDPVLLSLLRKNDDVFKNIAAEWYGISADAVNEEIRHQVKQIIYGIIYGMGDKALGEVLGKTAAESSMLSANFKRSFAKLNDFIKSTISECQKEGKIKTLAGRVRYLPLINSSIPHSRAQAERQAVNSKIQGSAADIAKKAMVEIEKQLDKKFPDRKSLPTDGHSSHLVLQLHDELIFEVNENLQDCFIGVLRDTMEKATIISVPLPVVIKVGKSWGSLKEIPQTKY